MCIRDRVKECYIQVSIFSTTTHTHTHAGTKKINKSLSTSEFLIKLYICIMSCTDIQN